MNFAYFILSRMEKIFRFSLFQVLAYEIISTNFFPGYFCIFSYSYSINKNLLWQGWNLQSSIRFFYVKNVSRVHADDFNERTNVKSMNFQARKFEFICSLKMAILLKFVKNIFLFQIIFLSRPPKLKQRMIRSVPKTK